MALIIKGIRLEHLWIGRDDDGKEKVTAAYRLMNDKGDPIGSKETLSTGQEYGGTKFQPSAPVQKLLRDAAAAYRKEVELSVGLEGDGT